MKTYHGQRIGGVAMVRVIEGNEKGKGWTRPLPLRGDLMNHSPTGFEWGYGGSGPAQLALALLADALGDTETAKARHQDFKRDFVAQLPEAAEWQITDEEIRKRIGITATQ